MRFVPQDAPIPTTEGDAPDPGVAFVLRCRRERAASAEGRLHFQLQQVGADRSWRFTDLDEVFETLRERITRLLQDGGPTSEQMTRPKN